MEARRMTAVKVWIGDIVGGRFVREEGMSPNYVVTPDGMKVGRAWITGCVVAKYTSDDGNFSSITIDDSTGTIRAKTFGGSKLLSGIEKGDIVDLIGKIKEYNEEIYISPEAVVEVDEEAELLRALEKNRIREEQKRKKEQVSELMGKVADMEELKRLAFENYGISEEEVDAILSTLEEKEELNNDKEMVLKLIEELDSGDGASYTDLLERSGLGEAKLDSIINELLESGLCYEPRPGKIKRL